MGKGEAMRGRKEWPVAKAGRAQEYRIWKHMIHRCHRATNGKDAANYRNRGITVCDRWRDSFEAFFADMGFRPSMFHSIGRRDNDGNYEPNNCRWETMKEQNSNRRLPANRHDPRPNQQRLENAHIR